MLRQYVEQSTVGDTVYFNVTITNPETSKKAIPATISLALSQPIVEVPKDYRIVISRINIPGRSIPLFFFQTRPFPNDDPNIGIYSVVIGYQGNYTAPIYLEYIPETFADPLVSPFTAQQPQQDDLDTYYYTYSYVNLAHMVTTALRSAIAAGAGFLPAGVDAYMIYNNQSGFFSLLGTKNMASSPDPRDPNNIQIYFNTPLSTFFTGFKSIHKAYNDINGQDEMILIENDLNNDSTTQDGFNPNIGVDYYQIQLEFNSDSNLETLSRIFITSDNLGGIMPQTEINNLEDKSGAFQNVIADFIPAVGGTGAFRSKIQYFASSEFYRRSLLSMTPLTQINLNFIWQGIRPTILRNLFIEPCDKIDVQLFLEKI